MSSRYDRLVPGRTALGAASFFRPSIVSAEARCQVNRGINADVFAKTKEWLRFIPFFVAFYCLFFWEGTISYFLCFIINSPEKHFTSTKKIIKIQILYFFINYTILFQNISSNYVANANNLLLFSKNNSKNLAKKFLSYKNLSCGKQGFWVCLQDLPFLKSKTARQLCVAQIAGRFDAQLSIKTSRLLWLRR